MMRIESRLLFDGALGVTADAIAPEPAQTEPNTVEETVRTQKPTDDPISGDLPNLDNAQVELASPDIVVFIDERLSDREQLLAGAPADTHVVLIHANRSGVDQMAQALDGLAGVQSIHIISTGEPGRLNLGGSVLTAESIRGEFSEQLAQLGGSLSETADILIYGCNFGADTEEGSAAQAFADATGADVASSTDLTGHASRGGDWVLERQTGAIETVALNPTDWTGLLDPVVISTTNTPVITNPAGTNLATPYNINGIAQGGSLIQPGGGTSIVGTTALWTSAGSVGGQTIDLRATVLNAGANDMIQFSSAQTPGATTDDPIVVVGEFGGNGNGPAQDVQVQVRWEVLETGTNNQLSGDLAILFTDIDGVAGPGTREAIAASIFDPVSYTLENPTDLVGSVQGNLLQVDGTVPNTGGNESQNNRVWTRFNWINESEFEITYILYANNNVTFLAGFSHDGDGDLVFTNPVTASIPKLDLDQSAAGNDYATTFTEDGSAVAVADTDVTISNSGGTIESATVTLTNRLPGDTLNVGTLPGGLTANTDTSDPNAIVVTITGTGTDAQYEAALQAVTFSNASQAPDSTQRVVDIQVENTLTPGNTAQTLINVVPLNDAPTNSVPGAQALTEDVNHSFGTATSNAITVSDPDAAGANLTTTLSVPAGALDLGSTAGVTVSGNGTGTVSVTGSAAAINAALNGLTYTPVPHDNGAITLTVLTTDNGNTGAPGPLQDSDTITLNIAAVNDSPYANDDNYSTNEDIAITFDVRSNDGDVDGPPLNVTQINGTAISIGSPVALTEGTISLDAGGLLTFTPNENFSGTVNFSYLISDVEGLTATANATITVAAVNDAPAAVNDSESTAEDTDVSIDVLNNDSDVEGDSITITEIDGSPAIVNTPVAVTDGTVTLQPSGELLFSPTPNFNGNTTFDYQIDDGNGGIATATVTVNVTAVNDLPVAGNDSYSTNEDTSITFDVRSNDGDVDNQPLNVSHINGTPIDINTPAVLAEGTITIDAAGILTFAPNLNFNGPVNFNYTIDDGNGGTDNASVQITVTAVDDPPVATNDNASTNEDTSVTIDALGNDTDPEGASLSITQINGTNVTAGNPIAVADGQVTLQPDGSLFFEPAPDYNGDAVFTYTVTDGTGNTDVGTVTVDVQSVNDVPVANPDTVNTIEDTSVILDVVANDTDTESGVLSVISVDGTAAVVGTPIIVTDGSVTLQPAGTLLFVPTQHYNGSTTFDYTIQDSDGATATATATVNVSAVNDAPYAGNDTQSTAEDTPVSFDVRANDGDVDGDPLTVSEINGTAISVGNPVSVTNGEVSIDAVGVLTFTPDTNYNGDTSFNYQVSDGNGAVANATATVTVTPVNDAPVANNDSTSTAEETPVNLDLVANDTDVDSATLSVVQVNGTAISVGSPVNVANGTVSLLPDGTIDFEPTVDFFGVANFTYLVSDGNGGTDLAMVQVTVTNVNDAPVAANDSTSTAEDTAVAIDVLNNDSDVESDTLRVSEIDGQAISIGNPVAVTNGLVALQTDGQLLFTPAANYNGPVSFDYTVTDGNGGTDTASVDITVTAVNDAPVATNDNDTTNEDVPVSLDVIANDTDVDGDSLSVTEVNGQPIAVGSPVAVTNGSVALQPNGELQFTPASNYTGPASFNYTVADNSGASDTATVTLTVNSVNDAPVATDDSDTLAEDTPITLDIVANDSDIDGDALAVTHVNGTAITTTSPVSVLDGTVSLNSDGTVTFTPTTHFTGTTNFTYTVADPSGLSDDANVELTVSPVNDAPVANNDSISTSEDTPVSLDVRDNDSDVDGDTITVTEINGTPISVGNPVSVPNGTVSINPSGRLTFAPALNYVGPATFSYTISDGNGLTASATVGINVAATNDAPVAVNDSASTPEDTTVNMDLASNDSDVDGDTLVISEINGTAITTGATVSITNGSVTLLPDGTVNVTPTANYTGNLVFDYTVSDGAGGSDSATADVNVTPVNDAPVAIDDSATTNEDTTVNLDLVANDTDIDSASLTVTEINGQPVTSGSSVSVPNGVVTLLADGTVDVTPDADYFGPITFDYTVSDGSGASDTGAVTVTVDPINDAPIAVDNSASTPEDTIVTLNVVGNDTDIDGGSLTVSEINGQPISVGNPVVTANGIVSLQADGLITFQPNPNTNGPATFNYTVSDGNGGVDTALVTINVTAVNDNPVATNDSDTTAEDTAVSVDVLANDTDIDGDTLSVSEVNGQPIAIGSPISIASGSVELQANGELLFTPAPDYNGNANFDYTVSDGNGGTNTATVIITVSPVNDAPIASDDSDTFAEDTPVTLDLVANDNDIDGDAIQITAINGSPISVGSPVSVTNGSVALQADGTVIFTPATNYNGPANFSYTIADPGGATDSANVNLNISPVNDAPVAVDESTTTTEDTPVSLDVVSNDSDPEGDALSVTEINGSPISVGNPVAVINGSVSINASGSLTFTPAPDYVGPASFTYTVSDPSGATDSASVAITVTAVNDTPVSVNDTATTPEETTVNIDVVDNDSDVDGDSLAVTQINGQPITVGNPVTVPNGIVTLLANGTLNFAPATNFTGSASFDYTVADPSGATSVSTVTVSVTPVNDAPVANDNSETTAEDTPVTINVIGNDTDLDGDALAVTQIDGQPISVGNPVAVTNGSVSLQADGQLVFTPDSNYNGPASFAYTVADPSGATDTANVSLTITPSNDAPVANNDTDTTAEDIPVLLDVISNDTDADGDSLQITQVNGSAIAVGNPVSITNGVISIDAGGALTFTPNANYNGPVTFDYTVSDGNGLSDSASVSITVTAVNDGPVAISDSTSTAEDTPVNMVLTSNDTDIDGDTLVVAEINGTPITVGNPAVIANGTVTLLANGSVDVTPNANFTGDINFNYTVSDGQGGFDTTAVVVTVTPVNDAPTANNDVGSTPEDTPVLIDVVGNDTDIEADTLIVTVVDGQPISVGNPAVVTDGMVALQPDGQLLFTPLPNFNGLATFDYTISDSNGATDSATAAITVSAVNDAPVAVNDSTSTPEDTAVIVDLVGNDTDVDGDALTPLSINGTPLFAGSPVTLPDGVVSVDAGGVVTFTPNTNYNGPVTFDYTVIDSNGGSDSATVDITVTPVNDAPVSADDSESTQEDTPVNIDVLSNDADPDGDVITINAIDGNPISVGSSVSVANGSVELLIDGTLSFTPDQNFAGLTTFAYTVSDPSGATSSSVVTVSVAAQNDAPVATNDAETTSEDTPVTINVVGNDTDVEGDSLTVSAINGQPISVGNPVTTPNSTVSLLADGQLVFTPAPNYNGPANFSYTVVDGNGGSDTAQVTVVVTAANDAPVALNDSDTTAEDTAVSLDVLTNDTDIDGDSLSVNSVDGQAISVGTPVNVTNGTVELLGNGELLFTPATNFNGNTAFDYSVTDGNGASDTATVNLTVTPVNDAPVATDDSDTLAEDTSATLDLTANDTDIDPDTIMVTAVNGSAISTGSPVTVANGTVSLQPDGSVIFTPEPHFNGNTSFNYTIADSNGATDDAQVNLTVTPVNDAPFAVIDIETTAEDTPVLIDVRTNDGDVDGDALTVTQINGSAISVGNPIAVSNGTVSIDAAGRLTFSPAANYTGLATFDYTVSDGNGASATATANITVTPVNDAPVATDDNDSTNEDTAISLDVLGNDTDAEGDSLVVNAIDGQPITVGSPVAVSNGTVELQANGELLFTPTTNYNGPASFDYSVTDGNGGTATATVTLAINPVNDAPIATDDTDTLAEDSPITLDLVNNDTDPDGDSLAVTEINGAPISIGNPVVVANGSVALQPDGSVIFTPAPDYTGLATFAYTVADPTGATDTANVNLTVSASNDAPVAVNDADSTAEDTPVTLDVLGNDSDADGDSLTVTEVNGTTISVGNPVAVTNGSVSIDASGALTFTPNANYTGPASFAYTVSDGNGLSDTASVDITVTPVNDGPTATLDNAVTNEDTLVNLALTANDNDPDGDSLVISAINGTPITVGNPFVVANGTVTLLANGTLDVMPAPNFNGDVVFDYTISDGAGGTDTATATIEVTPVNDAPTANNDAENTTEDTPLVIDVIGNDTDIEAESLVVTQVDGQPISVGSPVSITNGTVSLQADGQLLFTPSLNYNGPAGFNYTISDGNGGTDTASVSINISAVNDAPVAIDDSTTTPEDTAVVIDLVGNDTDADGDALSTLSINGTPLFAGSPVTVTNGIVTVDIAGVVTFTPDANYSGPVNFDYTVIDSNGATDTASVDITVTPVNDAPISIDDGTATSEDTPVNIDVLANDSDPDADALTITEINGSSVSVGSPVSVANGTVELLPNDTLDFTPDSNFTGQTTFAYTVSDPGGLTSNAVVTVSVAVQNDAPIANNDIQSTNEDTPVTIDVIGNDTDVEGDALSVSAVNGQTISVGNPVDIPNGSVALQPDGQLLFTPAANYNGLAVFSYTVIDGNGGSDTAQAAISVAPVNDNPQAVNDSDSTAEDTAVSIDVLTNDTDIDGDSLSVSEVNGQTLAVGVPVNVANGSVELQNSGELLFTPTTNFNGNTTFDYTVTDGSGSDTATVNLTVNAVNDAPVAIDDSDTLAEDTAITLDLVANDTDIDPDALTVTHVNGSPISTASSVIVTNGTVALQPDGTVIFTPEPHFTGVTNFTYTVADPSGASDDAQVDLTVTPVNDLPYALTDSATTPEDTPIAIDVRANDGDVDNDPLTVTDINSSPISVGNPVSVTNGTVSIDAAGVLTFTPDANYTGPATFDYSVSDGNGANATATVNIVVTTVNDNPVAVNDGGTTPEDTTINLDVVDNDSDIDGDTLSVSEINGTAISTGETLAIPNGSVTLLADGTLDISPAANYTGALSFNYTTSDGAGGTDTADVNITVTAVNDAPVAVDDSTTTAEEVAVNLNLVANDTDVDSATLTVTEINGQPVSAGSTVLVPNGTVTLLADGTVDVVPGTDYIGPLEFNYSVSDGNGGSDVGVVTVTVTPANDAPVATDDNTSTQEDTAVAIDVVANDSDAEGDALTVSEVDGQAISIGNPVTTTDGIVSLQPDGQLSFAPNLNTNGVATFNYTVADGNGGTDTALVTVNIAPVNDAPVAIDDNATTPEETAVVIDMLANDTDVDGDTLATIEIAGTPAFVGSPVNLPEGQVTVDINGVATFTPNTDFVGPLSFEYTVMDTSGATATGTVNVTVTPVNDAPDSVDDNASTNEDTTVNIDALANDTDRDNDTLTISEIDGQPIAPGSPVAVTDGTVELLANGTLNFTPSADFTGPTSFAYTVTDPGGLTSSSTVNVVVAAQNDAPIATDDADTTAEETPVTVNVTANDNDVENDALSVTEVNGQTISVGNPVDVANGSVALLADGQLQITPDNDYNGLIIFSYGISDGNGGSDSAQVDITVTPVDDAPIAVNDSVSTPEDTPVAIDAVVNDIDVDGDALTVTQINGTSVSVGNPVNVPNGVVSIDATGTLTFTPAPDYNGPAAFNYTVSDPAGNTSTGVIDVTIAPANDAPIAVDDAQTTAEETPVLIDVLGNDTDVEADTLAVSEVNGQPISVGIPVNVPNGTVTLQPDGQIQFAPTSNFNGLSSFDYTVTDGAGGTDTATVNVDVTPVPDAPIAVDDNATGTEDVPVVINVIGNDQEVDGQIIAVNSVDGQPVTVGAPVSVANGSVTLRADGQLLFTPTANFNGITSFDYTIVDTTGLTSTATANVDLAAVNDPPVAIDNSDNLVEDVSMTLDLTGNDVDIDGEPLVITQVNGNPIVVGETVAVTNGWVTLLSDGIVDFTPAPNYNGPASFAYTVSDGSGLTDSAMVNLNIAPVPDAPELVDDSISTPEETTVNIDPLNNDIDPDANPLSIIQVGGTPIFVGTPVTVPGGSVSLLPNGTLDFTPNTNFDGTSNFTYTVGDGTGLTSTANVSVAVTPQNDPPVAADESDVTAEDTTVNIDVLANDTDPDDTNLSVTTINGTPVLPGSPIPVANGSVTLLPDGTIDFEPAANYNGTTSFNYEVSDPLGATDTGQVTIDVTPVNDAPTVSNDTIITDEETPIVIDPRINDSDVEGSPLTITGVDGTPITPGATVTVDDGTVTMQPDGTLVFTPTNDFFGPTQFSYTVSDGSASATATVDVTVNGTDDPPTATNDMLTAQEDTPLILDLLGNDTDPDGTPLQITEIDGQPIAPRGSVPVLNGTVVMDPDGSVRFLPDPHVNGPTSFTYTISDPSGLTSTAIAELVVNPVPDAPEPVDDVVTIEEDGSAPLSLIDNDTDPDGGPLTLTAINGTPVEPGDTVLVDNGSVTVGENGQVTFIPDPNFNGQTSFSYEVTDPTGASATAQVTANVTPVNDPPVAQPDTVTGVIGEPVTFNPISNDNDADSDPLTITRIGGQPIVPGQTITIPEGTVTLLPGGTIVFEPIDPEQREFELSYEITDPSGLSSPATVSITVGELGRPQEAEDDINHFEYDPLSLSLPLERGGEYNPVFISPAVRVSQQLTGNADLSATIDVQSPTNDVFAWNHSANLNMGYGQHYMNFAYVRSDDPMARNISGLICGQFDHNKNLECWPQIRPESVANMQYILLSERVTEDTSKPDPNWRPADIKPEPINRQSVSDLFPLSSSKATDKPAGFSEFSTQINAMANKPLPLDAELDEDEIFEEPELENQ